MTVFGFIAQPREHFFLKPLVTRTALQRYGLSFSYRSQPAWDIYAELIDTVRQVRSDLRGMHPRDMIDLQSFLWVQGSSEYDENN